MKEKSNEKIEEREFLSSVEMMTLLGGVSNDSGSNDDDDGSGDEFDDGSDDGSSDTNLTISVNWRKKKCKGRGWIEKFDDCNKVCA